MNNSNLLNINLDLAEDMRAIKHDIRAQIVYRLEQCVNTQLNKAFASGKTLEAKGDAYAQIERLISEEISSDHIQSRMQSIIDAKFDAMVDKAMEQAIEHGVRAAMFATLKGEAKTAAKEALQETLKEL